MTIVRISLWRAIAEWVAVLATASAVLFMVGYLGYRLGVNDAMNNPQQFKQVQHTPEWVKESSR